MKKSREVDRGYHHKRGFQFSRLSISDESILQTLMGECIEQLDILRVNDK